MLPEKNILKRAYISREKWTIWLHDRLCKVILGGVFFLFPDQNLGNIIHTQIHHLQA